MEPKFIAIDTTGEVDPVCNRKIIEKGNGLNSTYQGRTYRFCCPGCKREFDANPRLYPGARNKSRPGGFARES